MEHYLIIARSVTHAQRMESSFSRAGIRSQIFRAPRELTELGCAYAVQIPQDSLPTALRVLHEANMSPVKIYLTNPYGYQEAAL